MTQDLTPEAVAAMLEGVTPGPWKCCETTIHGQKYGGCWVEGPDVDDGDERPHGLLIPISGSQGAKSYTTRLVDIQGHDHNDANARFIAWAREAVPALAAKLAEVESDKREMVMQSLADLGQAQEAYEAQLAAEAEVARLRDALTFYDMVRLQNLRKRLRQAIKDQAEDTTLLGLIEEINTTTDRLINGRKN